MGTPNSVQHYTQPALHPGKSHDDEFDYKINTPHIDPRTGSILPTVNPLAMISHVERAGQQVEVLHNQSEDFRGDLDHKVGYSHPNQMANPRAIGALEDRQRIASMSGHGPNSRHRKINQNSVHSDW
jgi:hypothetical protein